METLQLENVNRDKFAVFLRDLTENSKINLKHMIEDLDKTETASVEKDTSKKGKKKPHIKKKDLIIQEQNKRRAIKQEEEDLSRMEFFLKTLDDSNPYLNFEQRMNQQYKRFYHLEHLLLVLLLQLVRLLHIKVKGLNFLRHLDIRLF